MPEYLLGGISPYQENWVSAHQTWRSELEYGESRIGRFTRRAFVSFRSGCSL